MVTQSVRICSTCAVKVILGSILLLVLHWMTYVQFVSYVPYFTSLFFVSKMKRTKLFIIRAIARMDAELTRSIKTDVLNIPPCCFPCTVTDLQKCWRRVEERQPVCWGHVAVFMRMLDFLTLPVKRKHVILEWLIDQDMTLPSLPWLVMMYFYNYMRM